MIRNNFFPICMLILSVFIACGDSGEKKSANNPLLSPFNTQFDVPPFDQIKDTHFRPAFDTALKQHNEEIGAIANDPEEASFQNTIVALENAGALLSRVSTIFHNLNSANTNDTIQAIAKDMAPVISAHNDDIRLNAKLFERVKKVYNERSKLGLDTEDNKLLEETYKAFVRSGANLSEEDKDKLKKINQELSTLTTQFGQNLLAESNAYELVVDKEEDLAGLSSGLKAAAAQMAKDKGKEGKWVFNLSNPSIMPFLQYAENRELRKQIWDAYQLRGNNGNEYDNKDILVRIANLRLEKAKLLGYSSHAAYVLEESMAENPANVQQLLNRLWAPALAKAKQEEADIQAEIRAGQDTFKVAPYDWRFYAEKIRQKRFALNEEEIKPYFGLKEVREGAFKTAENLWGISFVALNNIPVYHPDVEVYEVKDKDGAHLGLLYADFFPRESKRSGAWMTSYRPQSTKDGNRIAPVISIVCNFTKPVDDQPSLLTFDEANTLFHEFGHALHGLFSDVRYKSLAGTSVPRDFVELPSQIMENWASDPEVLKSYAKHYQTGEAISDELIAKIEQAGTFDQGFSTVEYLSSSFLDMSYHATDVPISAEVNTFEKEAMQKIGMVHAIIPRHKSTYFQHVFSGGYSAGYYSYIWSAVLDADAFAAFKERDLYDQVTASSFRRNILERGGTGKPAEMYRTFRGADPNPVHLMRKRGLD